jgi:DNA-binding XRE family transcriptional regulator
MTEPLLKTYLRTYRRRTGLSQDEVAWLLGNTCGTSVSRHELGWRMPTLETALAYETILDAPVRELCAGLH